MAAATVALIASFIFVPACSSNHRTTAPTTSTAVSVPPTSATTTAVTVPATGDKETLGRNNPVQGDCTTNTREAATSVGFVVLYVTASSFQANIELQGGSPDTSYGVFLQQVPGSCPQEAANGGTLSTGSAGRGHVLATVPRVPSATTFFVQLVPSGSGPAEVTSDRISVVP